MTTSDMPSILVPYDATDLSVKTLDKAKEMGSNMDYAILLLYTVDDIIFYPSKISKFISNMEDLKKAKTYFVKSVKEGIEKYMAQEVNKLKNTIVAKCIIEWGHSADEILAISKEENVQLIIMGSSGLLKKRNDRKGVGCISRWILEVVTCPVVLMIEIFG